MGTSYTVKSSSDGPGLVGKTYTSYADRLADERRKKRAEAQRVFLAKKKEALGTNLTRSKKHVDSYNRTASQVNTYVESERKRIEALRVKAATEAARQEAEYKEKLRIYNNQQAEYKLRRAEYVRKVNEHLYGKKEVKVVEKDKPVEGHKADPSASAGKVGHILADGRYLVEKKKPTHAADPSGPVGSRRSILADGTVHNPKPVEPAHGADPSVAAGKVGHIVGDGRYLVPGKKSPYGPRELHDDADAERPKLQKGRVAGANVEPERHSPYFMNQGRPGANVESERHGPVYINQPGAADRPFHGEDEGIANPAYSYKLAEGPDVALAQPERADGKRPPVSGTVIAPGSGEFPTAEGGVRDLWTPENNPYRSVDDGLAKPSYVGQSRWLPDRFEQWYGENVGPSGNPYDSALADSSRGGFPSSMGMGRLEHSMGVYSRELSHQVQGSTPQGAAFLAGLELAGFVPVPGVGAAGKLVTKAGTPLVRTVSKAGQTGLSYVNTPAFKAVLASPVLGTGGVSGLAVRGLPKTIQRQIDSAVALASENRFASYMPGGSATTSGAWKSADDVGLDSFLRGKGSPRLSSGTMTPESERLYSGVTGGFVDAVADADDIARRTISTVSVTDATPAVQGSSVGLPNTAANVARWRKQMAMFSKQLDALEAVKKAKTGDVQGPAGVYVPVSSGQGQAFLNAQIQELEKSVAAAEKEIAAAKSSASSQSSVKAGPGKAEAPYTVKAEAPYTVETQGPYTAVRPSTVVEAAPFTAVAASTVTKPASSTEVAPETVAKPGPFTAVAPSTVTKPALFTEGAPETMVKPATFTGVVPEKVVRAASSMR